MHGSHSPRGDRSFRFAGRERASPVVGRSLGSANAGQDPSALLTFPSDFLGQIEQQDLRVHDSCELQRLFAGNRRAVTGL